MFSLGCSAPSEEPSDASAGTDVEAKSDAEACSPANQCGTTCCAGSTRCSFGKCVSPGAPCTDSSDCKVDEVCDFAFGSASDAGSVDGGCQGGSAKTGRCMPRPPLCDSDAGAGTSCIERCVVKGSGSFAPKLKLAWGGQITGSTTTDVMMTPIVIELDDDNCDGKVNENDVPEIVFATFSDGKYSVNGTLHAISVKNGAFVEKWSKPGEVKSTQLAGGNIDGLPGNEVVACGDAGEVRAYRGNGSLLWATATPVACSMPAIADLDADGKPEVVVEGAILDGAKGTIKATYSPAAPSGSIAVSDVDGDGLLDVVTPSQAFHGDGKRFIDTGEPASFSAIGDFDRDGVPEIVAVDRTTHQLSLWHYDAKAAQKFSWVRKDVDINGTLAQHCPNGSSGFTTGGGPPTVVDFNGDGIPDVGVAGGIGYAAIDGAKLVNPKLAGPSTLMWTVATKDCSSAATGSSVFDFDGDGKSEVVYSDENYLRIYDGPTGAEKFKTCNTTATLIEYPVIADVDADGHADIVVVSNAYASAAGNAAYQCNDGKAVAQSGVRIFGDLAGDWVRTRRIWNEHAYHVTNVAEDGTIPKSELRNWLQPGLDNFRQNKQPGGEFAAPDAIVGIAPSCGGAYGLVVTVTNAGEAALPAGIPVTVYAGAPPAGTKLGVLATTQTLYPGGSEAIVLPLPSPPAGVKSGQVAVYAVVDDPKTPHPSWTECRTQNDVAKGSGACLGPN